MTVEPLYFKPFGKLGGLKRLRAAARSVKKFSLYSVERSSAEQKGRLKHRIFGIAAVLARCVNRTAGPLLKQVVATYMVGVGMGVYYHFKIKPVCLKEPERLFAGVLVVAAVDKAGIMVIYKVYAHICGAVDKKCPFSGFIK